MKKEERSPLGYYTIGIAALFLAGFLLLVVFGSQSYRNTVAGQNENMQSRALLSYLATTVKAGDISGGVRVADSAYGPVLSVADGGSGYAVRIYQHEGLLLEDYAAADAELQPEEAQQIGETELFQIEQPGEDLLLIRTDAGRVLLRLRSEGGGAA
ncbi:MAG: DUF4860 domain-containing protein [Oscillospiraceae bacterium]|nr:DUF4860 domain-containing protein [Oscillospiraceae bacterium]